jgi:hypothetical protein
MQNFAKVGWVLAMAPLAALSCGDAGQSSDVSTEIDGYVEVESAGQGSSEPTPSTGPEQTDGASEGNTALVTGIAPIQLTRNGALGFCIVDDQFLTAEITPGASGSATFSGVIHRGWNDPALTGCEGLGCQRLEEVTAIELSNAQQTTLNQLIDVLPEAGCLGEVNPVCDPCLVSNLAINGASYTSNPCTVGCSDYLDLVRDVEDSIDSLIEPWIESAP